MERKLLGLCFLVFAAFFPFLLHASDILESASSLSVTSSLTSSSSAFFLSFRPSSSGFYLAISFAAAPTDHPAWVANRGTLVTSSAHLTLLSSGDLQLWDPSVYPSPVWSSDTPNSGAVRVQLLDSGNLVLLDSNSSYVWQSFQHPSDTLLPGQNFTSRLTSGNSTGNSGYFDVGSYVLDFSDTGVLQLSSSSQTGYWADWGEMSSFWFDNVGSNITIYSSSSVILTFIPNENISSNLTRRLTLDVDGNMRMYGWDKVSAQWNTLWMAFVNGCSRVHQLCGEYGVCIYNPQPTCVCPEGFTVSNAMNLGSGCKRNYPLNGDCSSKYVEVENIDYPFNDYQNLTQMSKKQCKELCSNNCHCMAAVFWQYNDYGHCWLKEKVTNGFNQGSQQHIVFLKISESDPLVSSPIEDRTTNWSSQVLYQPPSAISNQSNISYNSTGPSSTTGVQASTLIAFSVVIAAQAFCFAAVIAALIRSRKKVRYLRLHGELEGVSGSPFPFSYQEIEAATENFKHKLGVGGFGTVYKGRLRDGKLVAVKQLEGVSQQEKQFRAEIATLGRIHHINLLSLVGFCSEGSHRLLVFEYMEKGSIDQVLFNDECDKSAKFNALDWGKRFQICVGVARGIHYLHEECLDCILHCDIKPQNILLDGNYTAKVADFGLAYLYSRDHTVKMSTIRGTRGYMAPEWLSNRPITTKTDVFSYGMLVMEIVSGRKNYLYTESAMMEANEKWCFPLWAYGKRIEEVVDPRIDGGAIDWKQAEAVLKVGFACIQADMKARPSIGQVVQMLEGILPIPESPLPFLFAHEHPCHFPMSSSSQTANMMSNVSSIVSVDSSFIYKEHQDISLNL